MGSLVFDGTAGLLFGFSLGLGFGQDLGDGHSQGVSGLGGRASLALGFDEQFSFETEEQVVRR